MKQTLLTLTTILLMATTQICVAQDPHFSQFYSSPLTLNPALTGKFDGIVRAAGNYRDQWPAINKAYVTSTISVDGNILQKKLSDVDAWGVGIMGMTDKTANGILSSNYISFSTAYHKGLDEDGIHQIGVGFQGTYATKKLDGTKLNFENELALDGTWSNPSGEGIDNSIVNVNFFDFNAGVLYNGSTNGNNNFYFGVSTYHINRPKESFVNGFYTLQPRSTIHAGGYFPITYNAVLHVSALHSRQAGANETVLGGAVAINVNNDMTVNPVNVYLGTWLRFEDALIPYVGLEFNPFRLGASYDLNTSSLKSASQSRGGVEISLVYIKRHSDGRKPLPCPKF
jgi:type IX secretion system PorP/SprF family membrane protein